MFPGFVKEKLYNFGLLFCLAPCICQICLALKGQPWHMKNQWHLLPLLIVWRGFDLGLCSNVTRGHWSIALAFSFYSSSYLIDSLSLYCFMSLLPIPCSDKESESCEGDGFSRCLLGLLYYFCSNALVEPPAVMSGSLLLARIVADAGDSLVLVQRLSECLKLKSYALMLFFSLTWFPYIGMNETLWNAENWPFLALKWAWERRVACFLCDGLTLTLSSRVCLAQVIY